MNTTPTERRLPWHTKLVYGLGEFGPSVAYGTVIPFYFLIFLTDTAGVRPGVAGSILFVARIWDAINDPLVGAISDRTRSRLGRRRPFMLAGAIPMAILYALLWVVPPIASSGGRALYYLVIYSLFDLFYTLVSGPYSALTPELSLDTDERTSIVTYRMGISILTGLAAAATLPFVFNRAPSMQTGFLWAGVSVGLLSAVPYLLIVALFRERRDFQSQSNLGLTESIRVVLRNRAFWLALLINWLSWLAIGIVEAVFAYYVIYWTGIPEEDSAYILAVILASAAVFLPLVNWLSNRFEKKWAFVICTLTWMTIHLALWLVPQAMVVPVFVLGSLAGLGVASAHVLPTAMGADVLEAVEVESGERQEGVFGGISSFIQKLGSSLALMSIGWVLDLTGYVPNASRQSASALAGIRSLISWVPAVLLLAAMGIAAAFPITREVHRRLTEEANRRRAERAAARSPQR
jgi:GPH family glycoside/pentoside/hexuronide:cation symporter